jgi:hypothetical protein
MATEQQVDVLSDGTMPCPVASPDGVACTKRIPAGWTADEGHSGGHFWASAEALDALENQHYDSVALISGQPAEFHRPQDCHPGCWRWGWRQ